jgi:lysophospholipase L1-like esterase
MTIITNNQIKIVTIIGDSLSMVRPKEGILYNDTYVFKLQKILGPNFHVLSRNRRANDLIEQSIWINDDILYNESSITIIYLGIVDCAPRLFSRKTSMILNFMTQYSILNKFVIFPVIKFKSKHRRFFTKRFPKTYVPQNIFKDKLEFIVKSIRDKTKSKVIIVNIADTSKKNKIRSYNFEDNINDYNNIINDICSDNADFCKLVDFNKITKVEKDLILDDGIHLSIKGHNNLAYLLYQEISCLND